MFRKIFGVVIATAVGAIVLAVDSRAIAQSPKDDHKGHDHRPRITVKGMCCEVEAKAVTKELMAVKGVKKVLPDVKAGTLTIEPDKNRSPSPKALWEATEKAKLKVVQLTMDHDKFTAKPKK
jgi:copper chaperone CopZ